jgi:CubicO group peptidase (beta-lactamase class C family)
MKRHAGGANINAMASQMNTNAGKPRTAALAALFLIALPLHLAQASCALPALTDDGWERTDPADSGFEAAALCTVLDGVEHGETNIHSIVIEHQGRLVAELYRRGKDRSIWSFSAHEVQFDPETLHDMRSVSKSVVGLLFGIAQEQGKVGSVSTPVLDFYPQYGDLRRADRTAVTLENLLTMSSGLEWNESVVSYGSLGNDETRLYWSWTPYRFVLSRPVVAAPGTRFNYNGGGTAVLADIVSRGSGMSLRELARTALFEPLGIHEWEWVGDLHGRPLAFAGLRLRPRDLAKIGRMVLDNGQWQGRQIVPARWVEDSLRPHIDTGDGLHYGYQWWTGTLKWQDRMLAWAAAFGNGGQRLFVVPELSLAVVITAGAYNDRSIGHDVHQLFEDIVQTLKSGATRKP